MIFRPDMVEAILAGRKTQTRRPVRRDPNWQPLPCSYQPGRTYAIQPGRGQKAVGRLLVLAVDRVEVGSITRADARAEGFKSAEAFYARWRELHGSIGGRCWRIEFEIA